MRQTCVSFLSGYRAEAGACLSWAVSVNPGVPLPAGRDAAQSLRWRQVGTVRNVMALIAPCLIVFNIISDFYQKFNLHLKALLCQVTCQGRLKQQQLVSGFYGKRSRQSWNLRAQNQAQLFLSYTHTHTHGPHKLCFTERGDVNSIVPVIVAVPFVYSSKSEQIYQPINFAL